MFCHELEKMFLEEEHKGGKGMKGKKKGGPAPKKKPAFNSQLAKKNKERQDKAAQNRALMDKEREEKIKENLNQRFKGINHIFTAKGAPVAAQPNPAAAPANQNNQQ